MGNLFQHVLLCLKALLYRLYTSVLHKNNKLWIFGAWKGNIYSDNSRYLYEYIIKNHKDIDAYWITKNRKVYEFLEGRNMPVLFFPSREARKKLAHARYLFQTEGYKDTGEMPVGGATVVQLWHGISCKAFSWFNNYSFLQKIMIFFENGNRKKFLWTTTSEFYTSFFCKVFDVPKDRFIPCGYPRCDNYTIEMKSALIQFLRSKGYAYVGLYLPTHRNWGKDFDNEFIINGLSKLDEILNEWNIFLLFKPHPNEVSLFVNSDKSYKNIMLLDGDSINESDVYQYLYQCDFLISDYSSVIYDYLIVDKPIILFTYDIENYRLNDGGLINEFFSYPVGPMVYSWDELGEQLVDSLHNDNTKEMRQIANSYFNGYNHSCNSESLYNFLIKYNES